MSNYVIELQAPTHLHQPECHDCSAIFLHLIGPDDKVDGAALILQRDKHTFLRCQAVSGLARCRRRRSMIRSCTGAGSMPGVNRCAVRWECQEFHVGAAVKYYAAMAQMQRSPNITVNWASPWPTHAAAFSTLFPIGSRSDRAALWRPRRWGSGLSP